MRTRLLACLIALPALFAGPALADEIRLLQPVGGTYKTNRFLQVKWDYLFMDGFPSTPAEKEMWIWLGDEYGHIMHGYEVVDVLAGSWNWMVKAQPGTYTLKLTKPTEPLKGTVAVSQPFTIEEGEPLLPLAPPIAAAPFPILSPVEGKEYPIGSTMTIQWDKTTIADHAKVWLRVCWPDGTPAAGAFLVNNTGSYPWTIKETAENWLRVSVYTQDNLHRGMSGKFHIVFPPKPRAVPRAVRPMIPSRP